MATDAQVLFKINADTSNATRNLSGLQGTGQKVDNAFNRSPVFTGAIAGIAAAATGKITSLFTDLTGTVMRSADAATKFAQTLKFAGVNDKAIVRITESVREFSRSSIFAIDDLLNTTALLAANGVKDADKMVRALGGLTAAAGGNRESFNSVARAYVNATAAGKLMTQDWNMLTLAIPGASKLLQDALKKNKAYTGDFREAMANGEISAKQFKKAIEELGMTDLAQRAATSADTFEGIIASFKSTVTTFGKNLLKAIGEDNIKTALKNIRTALKETLTTITDVVTYISEHAYDTINLFIGYGNVVDALNLVQGAFKKTQKVLERFFDFVSKHKAAFAELAVSAGIFAGTLKLLKFGKVLSDIDKVIKNIRVWIGLVKALGVAETAVGVIQSLLAAINPFGWAALAIAAVTALAYLVYMHWGQIVEVTKDLGAAISTIFNGVAKSVGKLFGGIGDVIGGAFDTVAKTVKGVVDTIVGFFAGIGRAIVGVVSPIVGFIVGIFSFLIKGILIVLGPLIEFWKGMFNIWLTVAKGAINIIVGLFRILVALVQIALQPFIWLFQTIINTVVALWKGFVDYTKTIFTIMMEVIKVVVSPIVDFFKVIGAGIAFAWNVAATQIGNVMKVAGAVITTAFTAVKNFVKPIIDWFVSAWTSAVKSIQGVFKGMSKTVKGIFEGIVNAIKGMMNGIIDGLNWVIGGINAVPGHSKVPKISRLAQGGITNGPTHALIGEAGPEAVVPLTPKGIAKFAKGLGITNTNTNSENNYVFNITANEVDEKAIESLLRRKAMAQGW